MWFTILLEKPTVGNTKEALKNFEVDLIIIDARIGTFLRNKKVKQESFHAYFAEGLHQGESTGKLD